MTQDEIIALAKASLKKDVIYHRDGIELEWDDLIDFFHAAQRRSEMEFSLLYREWSRFANGKADKHKKRHRRP